MSAGEVGVVDLQPVAEALQLRVEGPDDLEVASLGEVLGVLRVVLEHVGELDRAREVETAERLPAVRLVPHRLAERVTERVGQLLTGELITGDRDHPANVLLT